MTKVPRATPVKLGALAVFLASCLWTDFDAVTMSPDAAPEAETPDSQSAAPDASYEAGSGPDASAACSSPSAAVVAWTFDASTDGWAFDSDTGVTASLAWTNGIGMPSPGAMSFAVSPGDGSNQGAWLRYTDASVLGNLTMHTLAAWVMLDGDASPQFKVFAQTGTSYAWADGGTLTLSTGQWTCVSLSFENPTYNGPDYNPADVIIVGFQMLAASPFRIYVDSVTIY